jgi:chromosomal replication initiation ATPase DnaA
MPSAPPLPLRTMGAIEYTPEQLDRRALSIDRSAQEIAVAIATRSDLTVAVLLGRSRRSRVVKARRLLYRVLRDELGWSSTSIGRFANRDHTTILAALRSEPRTRKKP